MLPPGDGEGGGGQKVNMNVKTRLQSILGLSHVMDSSKKNRFYQNPSSGGR